MPRAPQDETLSLERIGIVGATRERCRKSLESTLEVAASPVGVVTQGELRRRKIRCQFQGLLGVPACTFVELRRVLSTGTFVGEVAFSIRKPRISECKRRVFFEDRKS